MPLLSSTERVGTLLAKRYRITSILAHGGMGVVFAAECLKEGSEVALKLPRSELSGDETRALRLAAEGRVAARLNHPNVVTVLDSGLSEDGLPFVVFERLRGRSLSAELKARGATSPEQSLAYLLPIAGALISAHNAGLVHRDVKPDNIYLHRTDSDPTDSDPANTLVPKLLDFGLAKAADATSLTRTGAAMGTPAYMAPEQAAGARKLTAAADVWSLSAVLWCCLDGQPPAPDLNIDKSRTWLSQAPTLRQALLRGLRKDPANRYPNIRAWVEAMASAALNDGIPLPNAPDPISLPWWSDWLRSQTNTDTASQDPSTPAAGTSHARKPRKRLSRLAWLLGALLCLTVVILSTESRHTPDPGAQPITTETHAARDPNPHSAKIASRITANIPRTPVDLNNPGTSEGAPRLPNPPILARRLHEPPRLQRPPRLPDPPVMPPTIAQPKPSAEDAVSHEFATPPFDFRPDFSASPQFKTTW